jgi:hypothetical protein
MDPYHFINCPKDANTYDQQPLHAGFAEDRGGNSVEVRFNAHLVGDIQRDCNLRKCVIEAIA